MVLVAGLTFHVLTLVQNFFTPFVRDVLLQHGMADCGKQTCINILRKYALASISSRLTRSSLHMSPQQAPQHGTFGK